MTRPDFEREIVEHLPFLRLYASARLRLTRDQIDDAVQATALRALERQHLYHDQGDGIRPWLTIMLRNIAISTARLMCNRSTESLDHYRPAIPPAADFCIQLGEALRALDLLSAEQRRVFDRLWNGGSYIEAAEAEGVPIGTVRSRMHRARENLKAAVQG